MKNLALLTHVTTDDDEVPVARLCFMLGVEDVDLLSGEELNDTSVFLVILNGKLLGVHKHPQYFATYFRTLRRAGQLPTFVSIYENELHQTIYIATDGGRVCRPLILVHGSKPKVHASHLQELAQGVRTFDDFLKDGLIEYLDVNEENNGNKHITRQFNHTSMICMICSSFSSFLLSCLISSSISLQP